MRARRLGRTSAGFAAAAVVALLVGTPSAAAKPVPGQSNWLTTTLGSITTAADGSRTSTLSLSRPAVVAKPLDRLGWKDRDSIDQPHLWAFTPDAAKVLGRTIDDGRACPLCDTAVAEMAAALAADPASTRVEHGQPGGLDAEGDAYLLRLGDDVWVRVRAVSGTVLYYLDAYHPWLHGQVTIT